MLVSAVCKNITENISTLAQGQRIVSSGMVIVLLTMLSQYYELGVSHSIIRCILMSLENILSTMEVVAIDTLP
jgi:hypothetical protein